MEGLVFTIFEGLKVLTLSYEESNDCLYYINSLLDKDESPESFIKYQLIKNKVELRIREIKKKVTVRHWHFILVIMFKPAHKKACLQKVVNTQRRQTE